MYWNGILSVLWYIEKRGMQWVCLQMGFSTNSQVLSFCDHILSYVLSNSSRYWGHNAKQNRHVSAFMGLTFT